MKTLKKTTTLMAIALLAMACIASCKKDDEDTENPVITVKEPTANDTISGEIHFEFTATDNKGLKEMIASVKTLAGTEIFTKTQPIDNSKTFSFHNHFDVSAISATTAFNVTLTAKDQSDNSAMVTIPIVVKP